LHKKKTMNIQAEKLELVRLILDTDNPGILASVKRIFSKSKDKDFWDTLPLQQKEEILEGILEIEKGETVSYEEFIKKQR
jgi:O6-methylguanine-DNA--protein-cysteine methyltransferase